MSQRSGLKAAVASLLFAVSAAATAAQQPAGPSAQTPAAPGDIVITQQKLNRDAVDDFVDDVTVDANGQIAMFRAPICPFVDGFVDWQNKEVEKRIRQSAEAVGLPAAKEKCSPNVVLMVAKDAGATLRKLSDKKPILFQGILPTEVRGLLRQKGPVWTWQTIVESGSDGRFAPSSSDYKTGSKGADGSGGAGGRFEDNASGFRTNIHSRVLKTTKPDMVASFILIDFDALEGLTLTQIADYATIRTLARTQAKPTLRQRTMLRLFDVPADRRADLDQLTAWDMAYLQALYRSSNAISANLQKGAITTEMRRRLARQGKAAPPPDTKPRGVRD